MHGPTISIFIDLGKVKVISLGEELDFEEDFGDFGEFGEFGDFDDIKGGDFVGVDSGVNSLVLLDSAMYDSITTANFATHFVGSEYV